MLKNKNILRDGANAPVVVRDWLQTTTVPVFHRHTSCRAHDNYVYRTRVQHPPRQEETRHFVSSKGLSVLSFCRFVRRRRQTESGVRDVEGDGYGWEGEKTA